MSERKQGKLRSWHSDRGYGLVVIQRNDVYFLHTTNVIEGPEEPAVGSLVEFDVAPPLKNGSKFPQAINAKVTAPASAVSSTVTEGGAL